MLVKLMPSAFEKEQLEHLMRSYAQGRAGSFKKTLEGSAAVSLDRILGRDFFTDSAVEVARGLLGREIVRVFRGGVIRGVITEVSAWQGRTSSASDGMEYAPGTIAVSTKYGLHLMDIATERCDRYSCVTLVGLVRNRQRVQGPGNVASVLKIDPAIDGLKIYDNKVIYITGGRNPRQEVLKRQKKNVPRNCKGYFYIRSRM